MRGFLRDSVCAFALMAAFPAAAQTAATPATTADQAADTGIADIVVTAQRLAESAQKTSLVLEVLDDKKLAGVTDVRQLQAISPGVQLGLSGSSTQTFIRGTGSLNANAAQESAVAYNVDGVFLFTSTMINPLMYDLERVEVLKGPQGTLYGRNASGGAINLITRGASLGKLEGYIEGEYGNYDQIRFTGGVNVPLTDTLAVRIAGQHVEHDGYLSDGTEDQNMESGRLRVLWEPSSDITLRFGVDGSDIDSFGAGSSISPNPTDEKFLGGLDPRAQTGPVFLGGTSILTVPPLPGNFYKNKQWSAFTQLDANLGFATLTVLPAYRYEKYSLTNYVGGFYFGERSRSRQKSIEARVANRSDVLKWLLGAYYFKINQGQILQLRNEVNFQNALSNNPRSVESYAFFGEATYSITPSLRLIGGLRYTNERTRSTGFVNSAAGPPVLPPQTPAYNPFNPVTNPTGDILDYPLSGRSSASAVTWKVGGEADLSPESLLFATVSRGFKGGGTYADNPLSQNTAFKPEYLTAFEIGSRNRFLSNSLQINGGLFYWKLKDQQVPFVGFNDVNQVTFITANAGKGHMYGGNVDITWRATSQDTLHFGVEYLKSKYDGFVRQIPSFAVLPSSACAISNYDPTPGSQQKATFDCSGQPLLRAPKWAGSASYERRFDLSDGGSIVFTGDTTFASSRYLTPTFTEQMRQKFAALFDASLAYNPGGTDITVTGWIRNIANTRIKVAGDQFFDFYSRPTLMAPRTYGLNVRYAF